VIDSQGADHGLGGPALVLLGGAVKDERTVVSQSTYRRIDGYRQDYWSAHRVARAAPGADAEVWWPSIEEIGKP
jgi:hypothetical protein